MGHERVGALPHTRQWRRLVQEISGTAESPENIPALATSTLLNVRQRFGRIHADSGFQAAFGFLLSLVSSPAHSPNTAHLVPTVDLGSDPSPLRLTAQMQAWVNSHATSLEYAELSKRAVADVITAWTLRQSRQGALFDAPTAEDVWAAARNGGAFSDICRVFFGKFTERYLKYFLDREASAQLPSLEARDLFATHLERHVDELARHAFETTKITQSFAAGWYNKHARQAIPPAELTVAFLQFAMGKLRQELLRESSLQ